MDSTIPLISNSDHTARFVSDLVGKSEDVFSLSKGYLHGVATHVSSASLCIPGGHSQVASPNPVLTHNCPGGHASGHAIIEPHYEKTGFLHMRKQRRRSASR